MYIIVLDQKKNNIANNIFSWYYLIEGGVESGKYEKDICTLGLALWKKYIDVGRDIFRENPYFNFIAGYTLSLHGFYLDIEYKTNYRNDWEMFMRKCKNISDGLPISLLAENFLLNNNRKKYIKHTVDVSSIRQLFSNGSLLDNYFRELYCT